MTATTSPTTTRRLSYQDPEYVEILAFYHWETELLNDDRLEEWLELLADDIRYTMPVRVTRRRGSGPEVDDRSTLFADNKEALSARVARIMVSRHSWSEDPPSRIRRFVSQINVSPQADGTYAVRSSFLVMKSRWNADDWEMLAGERRDTLTRGDDGLRVSKRAVVLDQARPRSSHFGFFF